MPKNKIECNLLAGLLQPLLVPDVAWKDLTVDFIKGLPKSEGKEVILVVVDRITKYAYFILLSHPLIAPQVANSFLANVYKLHGLPSLIVSDRDELFTSHFWQHLFKALGITLKLSTAYHLHTNAQTEQVN